MHTNLTWGKNYRGFGFALALPRNRIINALTIICFREKNLFKRPCVFHCSWKVVAISLTFLTLILSSVIVYFGGIYTWIYITFKHQMH